MRKCLLLIGLSLGLSSAFGTEVSEFERGFAEGKNSCVDTTVTCTMDVRVLRDKVFRVIGTGATKDEAFKTAVSACEYRAANYYSNGSDVLVRYCSALRENDDLDTSGIMEETIKCK